MELTVGTPIVLTKKIKSLHVHVVTSRVFALVDTNLVIVSTTSFNLDNNYLDYSTNTAMTLEEAQSLINALLADAVSTK